MLVQRPREYAAMVHIRQPRAARLILALRHVVSELYVLAAVQPEPALLERVLDWVWVRRDVAQHVR